MSAAWLFKPGCDRFAGSKGIRVAAQVASCKRRPDPVYRALPFLVLLHGDVAAAMHGEFGLAIDRLAQAAKTCCHERPSSSRFGSKLLRKLFGGFWGCVSNNCLRLFPACASTHFIKPLGSISQPEAVRTPAWMVLPINGALVPGSIKVRQELKKSFEIAWSVGLQFRVSLVTGSGLPPMRVLLVQGGSSGLDRSWGPPGDQYPPASG